MRHYYHRSASISDDFSGADYSNKPLLVIMTNESNHDAQQQQHGCCRANKFKIIVVVMAVLLIMQYLFGASIYNIRIFDYNIAQIYIWNDQASSKAATSPTAVTESAATASTTIRRNTNIPTLDAASYTSEHSSASTSGNVEFTGTSSNLTRTIANSTGTTINATLSSTSTPISSSTVANTSSIIPTSLTRRLPNGSLDLCPVLPPVLVGPIRVWFDYPSFEELEKLYPDLEAGGHGKPSECISRHKVAIIIPYRDREIHLRGFLHNMHSLLRKQQLDYAIYVVELVANETFNRAKLMNVGFAEALKQYDWQCAIFHDVDLLPEDDRNIYSCPEQPRHMSVAIDKFKYRLPYTDIFGGISALTVDQFKKVNGFSNDYWGWGGEDDDMASRVKIQNYQITRYPVQIARYKMIKHVLDKENPVNGCRFNLMYKVKQRWRKDGLSNLNYDLMALEKRHLFTRVYVSLKEAESRKRLDDEKVCVPKKP